jgi:LmbE family N-acetylglucosaminyl deacetylase
MNSNKQTRRQMLATSGGILGASLLGAPVFSQAKSENQDPMKILVTGAHPDDPESGCGGTIGSYVALGHEVAVLYLTRGEAGIEGVSDEEAAEIRTAGMKKEATLKHVSQKAAEWFSFHQKMDEFRGFQYKSECKYAESFVRQGFSGVV